jgi:predicted enzyme related to lactoylglutathione lyase
MIKHIAFTMYSVRDMVKARAFYEKDLGLEMTKDYEGTWVEYHLENGAFAITNMVPEVTPSNTHGGTISFEVDGLDDTLEDLRAKGTKIALEPYATPVCRFAVVIDPDGNGVMLHQKNAGRE